MEITEIFAKLNSGELNANSELGTRDESKQTRNFGSRIQKMKTVTGINARALVMKDVVIPFNPFTGKTDDNYNKKTPFRPILLVSQVLEGLNSACAQNADMKAFWEKELGIKMPDGAATIDEYKAFKAKGYIKPRVMSYYTVRVSLNGSHGFPDFPVKYTVDPTGLNEQGTYDYDKAPEWHKLAILFNAMQRPEADEVRTRLEKEGQSKEVIQQQRRAIFAKSPIGFVSPTNLLPFIFIPHGEAPKALDLEHPTELEQSIRYYSYTDKWTVPINEAMANEMFDEDMDFFDFTIKTPSSTDTKPDGKVYTDEDSNALYLAMTISNTDGRMSMTSGDTIVDGKKVPNTQVYKNLHEAAGQYFLYSQEQSGIEGGENFEKIMAASNRFRPIESIVNNLLPACNEVFLKNFANTKYFDDNVRKANSEILVAMNPKNALSIAEYDEDELQEAHAAQKESVNEIINELKPVGPQSDAIGIDSTGDVPELQLG